MEKTRSPRSTMATRKKVTSEKKNYPVSPNKSVGRRTKGAVTRKLDDDDESKQNNNYIKLEQHDHSIKLEQCDFDDELKQNMYNNDKSELGEQLATTQGEGTCRHGSLVNIKCKY